MVHTVCPSLGFPPGGARPAVLSTCPDRGARDWTPLGSLQARVDACWLSHLQYDWESPVWRHYLTERGR